MRHTPLLLAFLFTAVTLHADLLDSITSGSFRPESAPSLTAMHDGIRYARLTDSRHIYAYSYQTGQVTDTLFDAANTRPFLLDDIEGFCVSPDDRFVLLYRNRRGIYRRSFTADYYLLDTRRRELRRLSDHGNEQAPVFSPNGKYIAYSYQNNIYVHKVDFGTTVAVTSDPRSRHIVNGTPDWLYEEEFSTTCLMSWSADSKQLAFVRLDESHVDSMTLQHFLPSDDAVTDALPYTYPTAETYRYPRAGHANAEASVVVYDTYYKSLKTMQVPDIDDGYIPRIAWTAAADQLAIFRLNRSQNELTLFYANARSTICHQMYVERSTTHVDYAAADDFQFLADGRFIAVNENDGFRHAYLYDANGSHPRLLTPGHTDATTIYGLDTVSGNFFYQAVTTPRERHLYCLNINKKNALPTPLTDSPGWHTATFNPTRTYYIHVAQSTTQAPITTLCDARGKTLRTLCDNTPLTQRVEAMQLPRKHFTTFTGAAGDTLEGWIVMPPQTSGTHPLVIVQYSGPSSQEVRDRWRIDWEYYLALNGYIVACVDVRGTGGRGTAFSRLTYGQLGKLEAEDLDAVARSLAQRNDVDEHHIALWGWSYGGYQTLYTLSTTDIFCCGIAVAPVTDWHLYDTAYTERFMQRPQQNDNYTHSPIAMAGNLNGHLLIVSGTADDNVHYQNTLLYINALVNADKQFELMTYPDDNHFLRHGNNYRHLYRTMFNFLERHMK